MNVSIRMRSAFKLPVEFNSSCLLTSLFLNFPSYLQFPKAISANSTTLAVAVTLTRGLSSLVAQSNMLLQRSDLRDREIEDLWMKFVDY